MQSCQTACVLSWPDNGNGATSLSRIWRISRITGIGRFRRTWHLERIQRREDHSVCGALQSGGGRQPGGGGEGEERAGGGRAVRPRQGGLLLPALEGSRDLCSGHLASDTTLASCLLPLAFCSFSFFPLLFCSFFLLLFCSLCSFALLFCSVILLFLCSFALLLLIFCSLALLLY